MLIDLFKKDAPTPSSGWSRRRTDRTPGARVVMNDETDLVGAHVDMPALPSALTEYVLWDRRFRHVKFGQTAIRLGYITDAQLDLLVGIQESSGGKLGEVAHEKGFLTTEQVDQCLAAQRIRVFVDESHAGDSSFLTWIRDCRRVGINPVVERTDQKGIARLRDDGFGVGFEHHADIGLNTLNRAKSLIHECALMNASDIHILGRERFTEIQVRVKGELKSVLSVTKFEGDSLARAIYTGLSSVKEAMVNPYEYQDAQINGEAIPGAGLTSVRVIRGPCYPIEQGGSFMVARLQYDSRKTPDPIATATLTRKTPTSPAGVLELGRMGYTKLQIKMLDLMARMPSGVIMITGPTGSGKTSTLYQMTMHQSRLFPGTRLVTIENPVEYPMEWAIQLPIIGAKNDQESGAGYMNAVRMSLRMDPDAILLGELRGGDEAKAAIQAAMTGHLVWTTIHVTDPYMAIDRLENMDREGLARAVVCDHKTLRGIVAQRLVSKLCPDCRVPVSRGTYGAHFDQDIWEAAQAWHREFLRRGDADFAPGSVPDIHVRGAGCDRCGGDGIIGSTAVAEVVMPDAGLMMTFVKEGTVAARARQRAQPGSDLSMMGNAMMKVSAGLVDPRDVGRAVDLITTPDRE